MKENFLKLIDFLKYEIIEKYINLIKFILEIIYKIFEGFITLLFYLLNFSIIFLEDLFKNLDPSNFQTVIIGVLTILIPITIIFLSDFLKKNHNEFFKLVIQDEILHFKRIFFLSILGLLFFSFFSKESLNYSKIIAVIIFVLFIVFLYNPIIKVLDLVKNGKERYEKIFLKKLKFKKNKYSFLEKKDSKLNKYLMKIFKDRKEKRISNNLKTSWKFILGEKLSWKKERDFIEIFKSHIDNCLEFKKFKILFSLLDSYFDNIEKRSGLQLDDNFEKLLNWKLELDKIYNKQLLSNKKNYRLDDYYKKFIKTILKENSYNYSFYETFENHINNYLKNIEKIKDEEKKNQLSCNFKNDFIDFLQILFEKFRNIKLFSNSLFIRYFPKKWKILPENKNLEIPYISLRCFLNTIQDIIFNSDKQEDFNQISNSIYLLFPKVEPNLFSSFLKIFLPFRMIIPYDSQYIDYIKNSLDKNNNFYIKSISFSSSIPNNIDTSKFMDTGLRRKREEKTQNTTNIILDFFKNELPYQLCVTEDDFQNEDEVEKYKNLEENEKLKKYNEIRLNKIKKLKEILHKKEIKDYCKDNQIREYNLTNFKNLFEEIIKELKKRIIENTKNN